jgi:hypothetical protein
MMAITSTLEVSTRDLCLLQIACMDRITNLRALIESAKAREDMARADRLLHQVDCVEDLLARLVQL